MVESMEEPDDELMHKGVKGMKWKNHVYANWKVGAQSIKNYAKALKKKLSKKLKKFGKGVKKHAKGYYKYTVDRTTDNIDKGVKKVKKGAKTVKRGAKYMAQDMKENWAIYKDMKKKYMNKVYGK